MSGSQSVEGFFPVDDCFGTNIGRPIAELVENNAIGRDTREELVSFEEFVRGGDKKRGRKEKDEGFGGFRPIDGGGAGDADGFFDIALCGGTVPEDPMSSADRAPKGAGRSELYRMKRHDNDNSGDKRDRMDTRLKEWDDNDDDVANAPPTTKLRHSLCPTVGEGGGWLSGGRMRRESQDSAAYGYEPPEEPCPAAKMAKTEDNPTNANALSRSFSLRRSLKVLERQKENGTNEAPQGTHNGGHQMVQSNSLGDLMLSKFLCCFRALNPTQLGGAERKCGGGTAEKVRQSETDKCYSWDRRDEQRPPNAADFRFNNESGKTLVKEPGQLNGQPFQIEHCEDSLILLMDRTASLTVDDSRDCVILVGPCQGSIFLRDCTNILILAVCQQFRTRDCRRLVAHLFCATCPTIEETDVTVCPLLLNYSELLSQMHSAGLSPFVNHWNKVHNFTPETGKCNLVRNDLISHSATTHNLAVVERLNDFMAHSPLVDRWKLCIGNSKNSQLFAEEREIDSPKEDRILVLLQPIEGFGPSLRFYNECVQLAADLLGPGSLVAMHDIDLKIGEWEALLGQNKQHKKQKRHTTTGKIIILELEGSEIAKKVATLLHSIPKTSSVSAQLVEGERMDQYKKQLYRFCEIRQNI